ncbi:MAG: helix-hairpin-helix domain-containing protein [Ideonella sp.]
MASTSTSRRCDRTRRCTIAATLLVVYLEATAGATASAAIDAPAAHASIAAPLPAAHLRSMATKKKPAAAVKLVDINSAGATELKTLPGIGDTEAARIIANRPYLTKTELASKNVLPLGPFVSVRSRVVAMQPLPAVARR